MTAAYRIPILLSIPNTMPHCFRINIMNTQLDSYVILAQFDGHPNEIYTTTMYRQECLIFYCELLFVQVHSRHTHFSIVCKGSRCRAVCWGSFKRCKLLWESEGRLIPPGHARKQNPSVCEEGMCFMAEFRGVIRAQFTHIMLLFYKLLTKLL